MASRKHFPIDFSDNLASHESDEDTSETDSESSDETSVEGQWGGYDFVVAGNYMKELQCPLCLLPLKTTIELPCSHVICKICINIWEDRILTKDSFSRFPFGKSICPTCRSTFTRDKVHRSKIVDQMVRTYITVNCKRHMEGCGWNGTISDYEDHEKYCEHVTINCDLMGCEEEVKRRDLTEHKENCPYRLKTCSFCTSYMPFKQLKEHYNVCLSYPMICPHFGCIVELPRRLMDPHSKTSCEFAYVDCNFRSVGCLVKTQRKKMENHLESSMKIHMNLLLNNSLETKEELVKANNELARTKRNLAATERELNFFKTDKELPEIKKKFKPTNIKSQLHLKGSNLLNENEIKVFNETPESIKMLRWWNAKLSEGN